MLKVISNLLSTTEIHKERQRVDVQGTTYDYGDLGERSKVKESIRSALNTTSELLLPISIGTFNDGYTKGYKSNDNKAPVPFVSSESEC